MKQLSVHAYRRFEIFFQYAKCLLTYKQTQGLLEAQQRMQHLKPLNSRNTHREAHQHYGVICEGPGIEVAGWKLPGQVVLGDVKIRQPFQGVILSRQGACRPAVTVWSHTCFTLSNELRASGSTMDNHSSAFSVSAGGN